MRTDNIPGYPFYYISKRGNVYTRKLRGSNKGTLGNWYKFKGKHKSWLSSCKIMVKW